MMAVLLRSLAPPWVTRVLDAIKVRLDTHTIELRNFGLVPRVAGHASVSFWMGERRESGDGPHPLMCLGAFSEKDFAQAVRAGLDDNSLAMWAIVAAV